MDASLLDQWRQTTLDPDWAVIEWLYEGAPAGLRKQVEVCAIFPPYDPEVDVAELNVEDLSTQPGFENYSGVEDCEEVSTEMTRLVSKDYLIGFDNMDDAEAFTGGRIVLSKIGTIRKQRGGEVKIRLVP